MTNSIDCPLYEPSLADAGKPASAASAQRRPSALCGTSVTEPALIDVDSDRCPDTGNRGHGG
jgi:hypothetical protein